MIKVRCEYTAPHFHDAQILLIIAWSYPLSEVGETTAGVMGSVPLVKKLIVHYRIEYLASKQAWICWTFS